MYPQHSGTLDQGFFDTTNRLGGVDPYVYISVPAVRDMAAQLGYLTPVEKEGLERELEAAIKERDQLRGEIAEADKEIEAIHTLQHRSYRRPPGPAPRRKATKKDDEEE